MPDAELPEWLDKTAIGAVGVVTLADGDRLTVELIDFDEERNELILEVIPNERSSSGAALERRSIPIAAIVDFDPEARAKQPWPYSDPCRSYPFSFARFTLMSALLLCLTVGGFVLFLFLANKPYGVQAASAVVYTLFECYATFTSTRERRYLFTCPAVRPQLLRLLQRHLGWLALLLILQTALLAVQPRLHDWWNMKDTKGGTPFEVAFLFLCMGFAFTEVYDNRAFLDRSHKEFPRKVPQP
jgi:hypothetical protein